MSGVHFTGVRPRVLRRVLIATAAGAVLAGTGFGYAARSHADGHLDGAETAYVKAYGATAVCPTLDAYPTVDGVTGVMLGVIDDGFSADNAVDIINASVWQACPRHWGLLEAIGEAARGGQQI